MSANLSVSRASKIYLPACQPPDEHAIELRSGINQALLATINEDGLLLWDRRSRLSHLLSWDEIIEQRHRRCR